MSNILSLSTSYANKGENYELHIDVQNGEVGITAIGPNVQMNFDFSPKQWEQVKKFVDSQLKEAEQPKITWDELENGPFRSNQDNEKKESNL